MTHWVIYDDGSSTPYEADHFSFETSSLQLTQWQLVMMRPREVVVRRLALLGSPAVLAVMTDGAAGW
jgi:hypothetical protein